MRKEESKEGRSELGWDGMGLDGMNEMNEITCEIFSLLLVGREV